MVIKSITLFLATLKGYEVLKYLAQKFREQIDFVVVARVPNVQKDYYDDIREYCDQEKIRNYDQNDAYIVTSQYTLAISWRLLINLSSVKQLIIFHDSLLPKYRGFNPLVSYLINGEKEIGVSALFASEKFDRGDIIGQSSISIQYPIKIKNAIELITQNYIALANKIVQDIADNKKLIGIKQNENDASYSLWRDENDYVINWSWSADFISRFVDSVGFPYKGASTIVNGKKARIFDVKIVDDVKIENRISGKVIFIMDSCPVVVCGQGLLKMKTLIDDQTKESMLPIEKFRTKFN